MMMRRRLLQIALCAGLALPVIGAASEIQQPKVLVEMAIFDCPYCLEMHDERDRVKRAARRVGLEYRFVVLPSDNSKNLRERLYYGVRSVEGMADQLRNAFFEAQRLGIHTQNDEAALSWLEQQIPDFRWRDFARSALAGTGATEALKRAKRLAQHAQIDAVPVFVLINDSGDVEVLGELENNPQDKVQVLLQRIR